MSTKVGINGFGRIGRKVFKAIRDTYGDSLEVVAVNEEPLDSIEYKGNPASSSVDAQFCQAIGGNMVKVVTWYDNGWGFSYRTSDLTKLMADKL